MGGRAWKRYVLYCLKVFIAKTRLYYCIVDVFFQLRCLPIISHPILIKYFHYWLYERNYLRVSAHPSEQLNLFQCCITQSHKIKKLYDEEP